jgi:hypothetical protein
VGGDCWTPRWRLPRDREARRMSVSGPAVGGGLRRVCYKPLRNLSRPPSLLQFATISTSSRVRSCPLLSPQRTSPDETTRWGDGGNQLGRCTVRALVEKPLSEICRPSPYHLAMPPPPPCAAETYSVVRWHPPASEGLRRPSPYIADDPAANRPRFTRLQRRLPSGGATRPVAVRPSRDSCGLRGTLATGGRREANSVMPRFPAPPFREAHEPGSNVTLRW